VRRRQEQGTPPKTALEHPTAEGPVKDLIIQSEAAVLLPLNLQRSKAAMRYARQLGGDFTHSLHCGV
jgi:hypothetical protein